MTVREAGRRGGQTTKARHGRDFYVTIGRKGGAKGGQRVRQLVQEGRRMEQERAA
jgi:general stress protein YciG